MAAATFHKGQEVITVYPTQLDTFTDCGHLFELEKVHKIPGRGTPYFAIGNAVDEAINKNLISMRDQKQPLDMDTYIAVFEREWSRQHAKQELDYSDFPVSKEVLQERARMCAILHYERVAPSLKPNHVQARFQLDIGDNVILAAFPDFTETDGWVHDNKCSEKWKKDDQLPVRQAIFGVLLAKHGTPRIQDVKGFQVNYLIWGKDGPAVDIRAIEITQIMIDVALDDARRFAASVRAGIYPRSGTGWKCSAKWCGGWNYCKGAKPGQIYPYER